MGFFLPDRQGEIACVFLAGSSQEAAVNPSTFQEVLGLQARDVSVEPPATVQVQSKISRGSDSPTELKHNHTEDGTLFSPNAKAWRQIMTTWFIDTVN